MSCVDIPRGQSLEWSSGEDSLKIPPCPPMLLHCFIIDVNYEVQFDIIRSGLSRRLELSMPITIGTIPLKENFELIRKDSMNRSGVQTMTMDTEKVAYPDLRKFAAYICLTKTSIDSYIDHLPIVLILIMVQSLFPDLVGLVQPWLFHSK